MKTTILIVLFVIYLTILWYALAGDSDERPDI